MAAGVGIAALAATLAAAPASASSSNGVLLVCNYVSGIAVDARTGVNADDLLGTAWTDNCIGIDNPSSGYEVLFYVHDANPGEEIGGASVDGNCTVAFEGTPSNIEILPAEGNCLD
jgi:hypothetical protein